MNIWEIQSNLKELLDAIEEQDGELTPEQEEELSITQEQFADKMESYSHVITLANRDIDTIDEEINRLKKLKESKQKLIDRLKAVMAKAIVAFGDRTKSGGYCLDLGTVKFTTRRTESVESIASDEIYSGINDAIKSICYQIKFQNDGSYDVIDDATLANWVNSMVYSDTDITERTIIKPSDLSDTTINLSVNIPVSELSNEDGTRFLHALAYYYGNMKVTSKLDKVNLKKKLENGDYDSKLGVLKTNYSLQIK